MNLERLWFVSWVGCFICFYSLHAAEPIEDLERRLQRELEQPPKTAVEDQRRWDEIRKAFHEALFALDWREPEQKVIAKLESLFEHGASVETYDGELIEFVVRRHAKLVTKYLLDKGADPNGTRGDGKPLKIATKYGDQDIISLLVQHGAKQLEPAEAAQLRLTFASGVGDLKSIKQELSRGAKTNFRDSLDQTTPLIEAVEYGRLDAVEMLLSLGADPNLYGYVNAIDLFAANPSHPREQGLPVSMCGPLHAASLHGGYPDIIKLLLKAGARVSSTTCYKNLTPLHVAAKFHSIPVVALLLKEGAQVMAKDSDGKTPLDYAESGPIIKLLKAYGAVEKP